MNNPELGGQIPFFLESFLSKPASALPKGAQWILVFEGSFNPERGNNDYNDVLPVPAIKKIARSFEPQVWDIDGAIDATLKKDYQTTKGCMFAQAVQLPGESNQVNPEGFQQSGFIRTFVGAGRDPFPNLQVSFLDTNISFADNVIRPWVVATAHLGLIARNGEDNYRCNMSVYKLGVISVDKTPFILQKYTFFGACPVNVTGEEYNYTQTQNPISREASFIYHYYTIDSRAGSDNVKVNLPLPLSTRSKGVNILV